MRAIWKGSISFGLVNIPVSLYSATRSEELKFRLLRASDQSLVNYKRVAAADGKEVPWDQIVKGYEYDKGKYVILKEEDFKRVDVEATQTVDIIDFVELAEINPMYFSKPYYMEPTKSGTKAYVVLRDALCEMGEVGIAKVVIKTRQYLAAVKPNRGGLLLELMHFADELVNPDSLTVPKNVHASKSEIEMAKALIAKLTDKWNPERYKDDYRSALLHLIKKKAEVGDKGLPPAKKPTRSATNVIDLVAVLKQSLAETEKRGSKKSAGSRAKTKRKKAA